MQVAVVGTGYVGLVSGACLADFGHQVTCVDLHEDKIESLRRGEIPIFEPGLEQLVANNVADGRLTFTIELEPAVAEADVVFIAVGTPSRRGDGHADLTYVYAAAASIARAVRGFTVVVTKSTVPVGTGDEVERIIRETSPGADVVVVSNPEFLREGAAIEDFRHPDRIIIGLEDERAREAMTEVYRPLLLNQAPMLFTGRRTAELTKYAANAFLAMKLTFINEIADLCESTGANVQEVAHGIGLDERIGAGFLNAGPGFGGSCFPKDTVARLRIGHDHGSPLRLVEATVAVNDQRKRAMGRKVIAACGGEVRGKTIAVLGLTFKPDTDDMREAPSIPIVQALVDAGARVRGYDPVGMAAARDVLPPVDYATSVYAAAEGADGLVLVTEWNEFLSLDLDRLGRSMKSRVFIDLRNVYRRKEVEAHGFRYECVGVPAKAADRPAPRAMGAATP